MNDCKSAAPDQPCAPTLEPTIYLRPEVARRLILDLLAERAAQREVAA